MKNIHEMKTGHMQSILLVKKICKYVIENGNHEIAWEMLGSAISVAVKYGIHELIEECISAYPSIIWYNSQGSYLFQSAIKQRQVQVYNLVYQMSSHKILMAAKQVDDETKDNALHIAAKLAPPHSLNIMTGAALQMQRELQWFKEIENFVDPSYKEALNSDKKTPRMVFAEEHKELLREGQDWMKTTASSCTVAATLLVTVAFAATLTVPGGNDKYGFPLFLDQGTFMLFIISDAIALFSATTCVLMFLGILISRHAEDDFLYALPKRMTIGLVSLFLSLGTTMIACTATLALVLQHQVKWIATPLFIAAIVPICMFDLLQFSLFLELVKATYGPSMFHKQNHRRIH